MVDTHVVLWFLQGDESLPVWARDRIDDPASPILVSIASLWEAAIKRGLGKLRVPTDLPDLLQRRGFTLLEITPQDAWSVAELPPHHRDPFDRMLIAQATNRGIPIVTGDPTFAQYDVETRW